MKKIAALFSLVIIYSCTSHVDTKEIKRLKQRASRITIIRDTWGIPHVYGKTDADAVFGSIYVQCEESFERVERNYLNILGRMSEVFGQTYFYHDLKMKIIYDTTAAIADYKASPGWLKKLLDAFADGINFYLYDHPEVTPLALKHFEPWYPLLFTDGAYISTNTGGLEMQDIKNLYGKDREYPDDSLPGNENSGSNGFAMAPSKTATGNALLYINPHVSHYFRTEMQMVSDEGLKAYGAATWGQFFIFSGFNEHCGWMHTSSMADVADLYEEKIIQKGKDLFYEYDGELKPLIIKPIVIKYKKDDDIVTDTVMVYYTHHGPVMGSRNNKWLSLRHQNRSMNGLVQSWQRMKAKSFDEFRNTMQLRANTSTNTTYADDAGNIAYWHGNFIPKRDVNYNWSLPVDGSTSATEWKGIHELDEIVHIENPAQGWIQNCNSSPFSVSGYGTLDHTKYPAYMAPETENFRSLRAIQELRTEQKFTIDKLTAIGYDHYLPIFDTLLPPLFAAYEALPVNDPLRSELNDVITTLRSWDKRSSETSVASTIGIFWAYQLIASFPNHDSHDNIKFINAIIAGSSSQQKLQSLYSVISALQKLYGSWKIPWGDINRYQRSEKILPQFDDTKESLPVGMASSFLGCLPAYETVWQNNKRQYGVAGNSFVAVVEFGKKIKAMSVVAGGQSFDPSSKHFNDQTKMFIEGKLKDVFFYKADVEKNAEARYHPGEAHKN
jgi:acyl-homoserine-lactone acylase